MTARRLASLALLALLVAPARGQDAPKQAPALDVIADVLVEARKNKVLQERLFAEHIYYAEGRNPTLARIHGKDDGQGFVLEVDVEQLARGSTIKIQYAFDAKGAMTKIAMREERGERGEGIECVVSGDTVTVSRVRAGKPPEEGKPSPWRRDALPMVFTPFFLSSVADQGLPDRLTGALFRDVKPGRSSSYRDGATFVRGGELSEGGVKYQVFTMETESNPIQTLVFADGPQKGLLARIRIDYKKETPDEEYRLLSAEEAKKLLAEKDALVNEAKVVRLLESLEWKQREQKQQGANGAGSFADEASKLGIKDEEFSGYELLMRVSADGKRWMVVALPLGKGKSGKRYLAAVGGDANDAGDVEGAGVYASDKEIPMSDDCKLPAGLKKLR